MEKLEHTPMSDKELIAEFMGGWNDNNNSRYLGMNVPADGNPHWEDQWYDYKDMKYSTSWDWLMPVVEKIAQHVYEIWQDSNGYKEVTHHDRAYPRTFGMIDYEGKWMVRINRMPLEQESTLIEATYKAVVEFIKWHNSQPHKL